MAKRENKKIQILGRLKELTPENRAMLENRKRQFTKRYKEEMKFINELLAKPTIEKQEDEKDD